MITIMNAALAVEDRVVSPKWSRHGLEMPSVRETRSTTAPVWLPRRLATVGPGFELEQCLFPQLEIVVPSNKLRV